MTTHRLECEFCHAPDARPDRCAEANPACRPFIEQQCLDGDHRRCDVSACAVAARWHEPVRRVGTEAARVAGKKWALVSTLEDEVTLVATGDDFNRTDALRTAHAAIYAIKANDRSVLGYVYIVREFDGNFV